MRRSIKILLGLTVAVVLLSCLGIVDTFIIEVPFTLALGWIPYLRRVLPNVHIVWPTVGGALVCLAGTIALGHSLARWLWRETAPAPATAVRPPWRLRWTLAATAVVVLMFTSGIAAVGVSHQSAWLARSKGPLVANRMRSHIQKLKCSSNLRQVHAAIAEYAKANNGHYPDSLAPLLITLDITPEVFVCPASDTDRSPGQTPEEQARHLLPGHCDYVYHARGLRHPTPTILPIVCEPLTNHDLSGMNILFSDGTVEWHTPAEAQRILTFKPPTSGPTF